MKIAFITYSDKGALLAQKFRSLLEGDETALYSSPRFAEKYGFAPYRGTKEETETLFRQNGALVFICACGIAVRCIAPCVRSKETDPAVIVINDGGDYVIPILSGHIGGANRLAQKLASLTGALPVVTTATDGAGLFSCDSWAAEHGCAISSLEAAKAVSARILTEKVPVCAESELPQKLPAGLVRGESGDLGIYIGIKKARPFGITLRLVPRAVTLGIGCRKGVSAEAVKTAVLYALDSAGIDIASVCGIATADLKKDEAGLNEFAEELNVPIMFYTAGELASLPDEWGFAESEFVKKTVGVGNVCERAAVFGGGKLVIRKTAAIGVTVAAAYKERSVEF